MDNILNDFCLSKENIQKTATLLCAQIYKGLAKCTHDKADVKCYVSYVMQMPTGEEVGKALIIDLGGINFRVVLITLQGAEEPLIDSKIFNISDDLAVGTGDKLFDYIAECLANFIKERNLTDVQLPLGFTFSFPCVHKGLGSAVLVKWSKVFSCSGVVGEDVGLLLKSAIERRGAMKVKLVAIVNDTVATLISCAHRNPDCRIGVIIDTGCNAAYVEHCARVEMLEDEYKAKSKRVIVSTEWGSFGQDGCLDFIRTEYDREIDRESINKGHQIFEKMIAGLYLGEIVRLTMLKAIKLNLLFENSSCRADIIAILSERNIFTLSHICDIEGDCPPEFNSTRRIIRTLFKVERANDNDVRSIRQICEAVSTRSATLLGIAIAVLFNRVNATECIAGVDGALYRLHPKYDRYMRTVIRRLVNPRLSFEIMMADDGSGKGAGIIAASVEA